MKLLANIYNLEELNLDVDGYILNLEQFSEIKGNIKLKDIPNKKNIFLNLNKIIHNKELKELKKLLVSLKDSQIGGILFGDLSVLKICQEEDINVPLIWNQTHLVTNYQTSNFYHEKGVKSALLASELNLEEIIEFQKNSKLDIMVNIFGYQSMFKSYRKVLTNYFNYIKEENKNGDYYLREKINNEDYLINEDYGSNIFSAYVLDLLEEMPKLLEVGINTFIINTYKQDNLDVIIDAYKNYQNIESRNKLDALNLNLAKGFLYKTAEFKVRDHE